MIGIESIINQIDSIGVSAESLIYHILEERRATRRYVSDVTNDVKESRYISPTTCQFFS